LGKAYQVFPLFQSGYDEKDVGSRYLFTIPHVNMNNEDLIPHLFCTVLLLQLNSFCFFPKERLYSRRKLKWWDQSDG